MADVPRYAPLVSYHANPRLAHGAWLVMVLDGGSFASEVTQETFPCSTPQTALCPVQALMSR